MANEPLRVGVVGLGTIWSTVVHRAYLGFPNAVVRALFDPDDARLAAAGEHFPDAYCAPSLAALLARDDVDYVEVLVPSPQHCEVACAALDAGKHVQLQKPMASTLEEADALVAAAERNDRVLRVTEDYLFVESIAALRDIIRGGELGAPVGFHTKLVGTGRGAWDVHDEAWRWLMPNVLEGRGLLSYDHGWHEYAVAHWLFGPATRVSAWVGATPLGGDFVIDAPTTVMWDHANGVRGVFDITFAPDTYWPSDYYGGDERFEVTCERGFARVNWLTALGLGGPALQVYRDGELRDVPVDGDWANGLIRSTRSFAGYLRGDHDELRCSAREGREILALCLGAVESSRQDGRAVAL
jgi:predicted dehydrogenase